MKLRADLISFNSAIGGDFLAEQLLAAMPKLQLAPDVVSYNVPPRKASSHVFMVSVLSGSGEGRGLNF